MTLFDGRPVSVIALVTALLLATIAPAASAGEPQQLPRFASLKTDAVPVRKEPGMAHPVQWIYRSLGLPVEVIAARDDWLQVRDSEGSSGWVKARLVSALRMALVSPTNKDTGLTLLLEEPEDDARPVAKLVAGVKTYLFECDGSWCRASVENLNGWIEQKQLWGVYPKETFK